MRTISQEIAGAAAAGEQKSDRREISFGRVAGLAREDEIVAPIVSRLPSTRGHVVERHEDRRESLAAVGADRPVVLEEPSPGFGVSDAASRVRRELDRPVRRATLGARLSAPRSAASSRSRALAMLRFRRMWLVMPWVPAVARRRRVRGGVAAGSMMLLLVRRTARWSG